MQRVMAASDTGRTAAAQPPARSAAGVPDLASIVGYKLRRAQLFVFQDFIESFADLPLRPAEFSVLSLIAREPGRKQSEIAARLGIKRANFVALMDGLEKRKLAERRKSPGDKRSHSLHLTAEGHSFVGRMVEIWNAHEQRVIERLGGAADRDRLIEYLDRIIGPAD